MYKNRQISEPKHSASWKTDVKTIDYLQYAKNYSRKPDSDHRPRKYAEENTDRI